MIALRNALMTNQTLEVLRLVGTGVTSEGAVAIAEVLPENRSLRVIDLRDTAIDLGGLVALAVSMKHNQTLCALHVTAPPSPPPPPPIPPRRASVSNGNGGGGSSAPSSRRSSVSVAAAAAPAPPVGLPSAAASDSAAPASAPPLPPKDGPESAAVPLPDAPAPALLADGVSHPPTPAPATAPATAGPATATLAMTAPGADHVAHFLSELATQCQANQLRNQWTPVHLQTLARMAGFIPITAISFRGNAMLIGPEAVSGTPASTTPAITPAAIPPSEAGFFSSEFLPTMATAASGSSTPAIVAATVAGGGSNNSAVAAVSPPPRPPDIAALLEQMDLAGLRSQALVRTVNQHLSEEAVGSPDVETAYYVEVGRRDHMRAAYVGQCVHMEYLAAVLPLRTTSGCCISVASRK